MFRFNATPAQPLRFSSKLTAFVCAATVLLFAALGASPTLHGHVHDDAGDSEHACAITLFGQGVENPPIDVIVSIAPRQVTDVAWPERLAPAASDQPLRPGRDPPID